jgi:hypothetical protein
MEQQYKIEMRIRNHTTISRDTLIQTVARCIPECHSVDLNNPQLFILVEVFKVDISNPSFCSTPKLLRPEYMWNIGCGRLLSLAQIQCHGNIEGRQERPF